jgi:hypothetical protein
MLGEDKLSRSERIRLESLSQSLHMTAHVANQKPTEEEILSRAERIEKWLKDANAGVQ